MNEKTERELQGATDATRCSSMTDRTEYTPTVTITEGKCYWLKVEGTATDTRPVVCFKPDEDFAFPGVSAHCRVSATDLTKVEVAPCKATPKCADIALNSQTAYKLVSVTDSRVTAPPEEAEAIYVGLSGSFKDGDSVTLLVVTGRK